MTQTKLVWSWLPEMLRYTVNAAFRASESDDLRPLLHALEQDGITTL